MCSEYDIKPFDGKSPALEIWEMRGPPLLPLPPSSHWPRVAAPNRVLSMNQLELFDYLNSEQINDRCLIELLAIHSNPRYHFTECKRMNNV